MTEAEERAAVVAEALSWVRTPYHDGAMVKGAGVDCAMIIKAVYEAVGLESPIDVKPYSPQWYLHRSEELYLTKVLERAHEITEAQARPGDMVLYKFGRCFAHGAIIVDPGFPQIVHAFKQAGIVTVGDGTLGHLVDRERKFFCRNGWGT